jgi:peptidoglycan/LPS O-acetylase OafA/YrhL
MGVAESVEKLQCSNRSVAPGVRDRERSPNGFDGLRLIAAMLVFYSHAFALFGLSEPAVSSATPSARVTLGTLGVTIL